MVVEAGSPFKLPLLGPFQSLSSSVCCWPSCDNQPFTPLCNSMLAGLGREKSPKEPGTEAIQSTNQPNPGVPDGKISHFAPLVTTGASKSPLTILFIPQISSSGSSSGQSSL